MESLTGVEKTRKILLSGVFGPYGVDDEFGRKENIMELYHNQVTKAQGPASFRFHHRSFGLYFIAANIEANVTILDFPSRKRFAREIENGDYDMVGISFIMPNVDRAREMARIVREKSPHTEIILGGHGAAMENVERMIDCDHVVKGEGILWMREHLGQDPDAPIRHPALPRRPMGWRRSKSLRACAGSSNAASRPCRDGVSTVPGQMALQRTPLPTKSLAIARVNPATAALVAL